MENLEYKRRLTLAIIPVTCYNVFVINNNYLLRTNKDFIIIKLCFILSGGNNHEKNLYAAFAVMFLKVTMLRKSVLSVALRKKNSLSFRKARKPMLMNIR